MRGFLQFLATIFLLVLEGEVQLISSTGFVEEIIFEIILIVNTV